MTIEKFINQNPKLDSDQVSKIDITNADIKPDMFACGLKYDRGEGDYAILVATKNTSVIVSTVRNCKLTTRMRVSINKGDELRVYYKDNCNYDGYTC
jgi:hypothetical protein